MRDHRRRLRMTDAPYGEAVWSSASWREEAISWLDAQLAAAGIERIGEVEPWRVRPWAAVLKAPTDRGVVWLKAAGPNTAFEVGLYPLLRSIAPSHVLEPIAADEERGWIVLPDGGAVLGEMHPGAALVPALEKILPQYAELQRALAPEAENMVALGVTDMRAALMPARFDEAVNAIRPYVERHASEADRAIFHRAASSRATFVSMCEQLADARVAASIDHNDLHPWNVFVPGPHALHPARFYDWGDSVVAHPFTTLLVTFSFLRHEHHMDEGDPKFLRLRDAYLEAFTDLASPSALLEEFALACHVGNVARALTWQRAFGPVKPDQDNAFADAPMQSFNALATKGD